MVAMTIIQAKIRDFSPLIQCARKKFEKKHATKLVDFVLELANKNRASKRDGLIITQKYIEMIVYK